METNSKKRISDVQKILKLRHIHSAYKYVLTSNKYFTFAMHMTEKNESAVEHYGQADWR
jgi:hypothetical protein